VLNDEMLNHLALSLGEDRVFSHCEEAGVMTASYLITQFPLMAQCAFGKMTFSFSL